MKKPFALFLMGTCLISVRLTTLQAQEPSVEESANPDLVAPLEEGESGMDLLSNLPVHLLFGITGGYDDNVRGAGNTTQDSLFSGGNLLLAYDLHGMTASALHQLGGGPGSFGKSGGASFGGGNRTATSLNNPMRANQEPELQLLGGASIIYYPNATGVRTNDINSFVETSFSRDISSHITAGGNVHVAYQTQPDFASDVGVENQRANHFDTLDSLSLAYHLSSRFDLVTNDDFRRIQYDNSVLGSAFDRTQNTIGEELRFNFLQDFVWIAEYRYEINDYDDLPRDSTTQFALAGFERNINSQLKVGFRGGATFRSFDQSGTDRTDPHFESSVSYRGAHNSVLNWDTSYGIEEPNSTGVLARTTFRTSLRLNYGISSRLLGSLQGDYHHDQNEGSISRVHGGTGFSGDGLDASVGLRYIVKAYFTVDLGYERLQSESGSQLTPNYSRDRYYAGFTFIY